MKSAFSMIPIFAFVIASGYAQYVPELVFEFPTEGDGRINVSNVGENAFAPRGFAFDDKGDLWITTGKELIHYSNKYKYIERFGNEVYDGWLRCRFGYFLINGLQYVYDPNGKMVVRGVDLSYRSDLDIYSAIFILNRLFIFKTTGSSLFMIENPGLNSQKNLQNLEPVFPGILDRDDSGQVVLKIDMCPTVIYRGKPIWTNLGNYLKYWDMLHSDFEKTENADRIIQFEKGINLSKFTFLGEDKDGNTYWNRYSSVLVYDKRGWIVREIKYIKDNFNSPPFINQNGDIYLAKIETNRHVAIYMIARKW